MRHSIAVLALGILAVPAWAAMADFDLLSEGFYGESLTYGCITFYDVDEHLSIGPGGTLIIDDASATIPSVPQWQPFFTSPNVLAMTVLRPGPEIGSPRFGEVKMTTGQPETFASVDVLLADWGMPSDYSIILEAFHLGQIVATDIVSLGLEKTRYEQLVISGVSFDTLRLAANGPDPARAYFKGAIDNVVISPEPSSWAFVGLLAGMYVISARRRLRRNLSVGSHRRDSLTRRRVS
jgi:hypothetical protein